MRSVSEDPGDVCQVIGEGLGEAARLRTVRTARPPAIPEAVTRSLAEDVIRRLARQSGRRPLAPAEADAAGRAGHAEIDRLCDALVSDDPLAAAALIEQTRRAGRAAETLYLDYVAAAARRLGERWVDDTASFFEVSLGLSRLHAILRELGPAFFAGRTAEVPGRTAIFAPVPGETHVLGIVMASDFFRRCGWHVELHTAPDLDSLAAAARRRVALIGLSANSRRMIGPLAETILRLRAVAGGTRIIVGGHLNELEPGIAAAVGADGIAGDAANAASALQP